MMIEPEIFRPLMLIKNFVYTRESIEGLTDGQLVTLICDQIKDASDHAGLPLFRIGGKFYIIPENGDPRICLLVLLGRTPLDYS